MIFFMSRIDRLSNHNFCPRR